MSDEILAATTPAETTPAASTEAVVVSGTASPAQATTATTEAPAASGTLATTDPVEKVATAPADWPEDWRAKLAGEDKAYIKTLERYASPADLAKAHRELQARMSRGELKAGLKPDATPEEVAAWRKENGLPAAPEEYRPNLPNGMVPGEADKPLIEGFQKTAHELGMTADQFNKTLGWYYGMMDQVQAEAVEKDKAFRATAEDALRAEWGPAYRSEVRAVANFMEANAPAGLADVLFNSRTPDGSLIGDHPEVLRWLNSLARTVNPMASLVPAGTGDVMKAGEARIAEIEQMMKTDYRGYWNNPDIQREYGQLIEARQATRGRAA